VVAVPEGVAGIDPLKREEQNPAEQTRVVAIQQEAVY